MRILVADDDLELLGLVAFALRQAGYTVVEAPDGPSALEALRRDGADLVVLDVNMPRMSGFEALERIRAIGPVPVLMLTVHSSEEDQVRALDLGADDYLTKPFSPRTLLARVRALLRRAGADRPGTVDAGEFHLDPTSRSLRVARAEAVRLTEQELRLLQLLLANADRPLTSDALSRHVWGLRGFGDRQLLKQLVHRLRQKIEPDPAEPEYLVTVSGVGYVLNTTRGTDSGAPAAGSADDAPR